MKLYPQFINADGAKELFFFNYKDSANKEALVKFFDAVMRDFGDSPGRTGMSNAMLVAELFEELKRNNVFH